MRQLSGVRGCPYAWASSRRLQAALADAGIGYEDDLELALTTELHHLHRAEDFHRGLASAHVANSPQSVPCAFSLASISHSLACSSFSESRAGRNISSKARYKEISHSAEIKIKY